MKGDDGDVEDVSRKLQVNNVDEMITIGGASEINFAFKIIHPGPLSRCRTVQRRCIITSVEIYVFSKTREFRSFVLYDAHDSNGNSSSRKSRDRLQFFYVNNSGRRSSERFNFDRRQPISAIRFRNHVLDCASLKSL